MPAASNKTIPAPTKFLFWNYLHIRIWNLKFEIICIFVSWTISLHRDPFTTYAPPGWLWSLKSIPQHCLVLFIPPLDEWALWWLNSPWTGPSSRMSESLKRQGGRTRRKQRRMIRLWGSSPLHLSIIVSCNILRLLVFEYGRTYTHSVGPSEENAKMHFLI